MVSDPLVPRSKIDSKWNDIQDQPTHRQNHYPGPREVVFDGNDQQRIIWASDTDIHTCSQQYDNDTHCET